MYKISKNYLSWFWKVTTFSDRWRSVKKVNRKIDLIFKVKFFFYCITKNKNYVGTTDYNLTICLKKKYENSISFQQPTDIHFSKGQKITSKNYDK